jgi:hypothetical protein
LRINLEYDIFAINAIAAEVVESAEIFRVPTFRGRIVACFSRAQMLHAFERIQNIVRVPRRDMHDAHVLSPDNEVK